MNETYTSVRGRNKEIPNSRIGRSAKATSPIRVPSLAAVMPARSRTWRKRSMTMLCASTALVAVLAAGLAWAAFAKVAITATAQGKIAPLGRVQVVAHAEGGAVRALDVRVGQSVKAGDRLIELDATMANADLKRYDDELLAHEVAIRRLEAEQLSRVPDLSEFPFELAQSEIGLFTARQSHYLAELASTTGELESARAGMSGAEAALRPLRERLQARIQLAQTGSGSRFNVLEDQAKIAEMVGRLASSQASERIALANIDGNQYRREEEIAKSLVEHRNRRSELIKARPKVLSRLENLSVVAPLDGIIKSISVTGPGAVLKAGESLAEIVPEGGERLVVARLPAANVGYVHPGQSAQLTLMPPDMHFKPISGTVQMLAPDSIADERTGELSYVVQIKPDSEKFTAREGGANYPLRDGVPVAVTIVTGERTILGVIAGPLFVGLDELLGVR